MRSEVLAPRQGGPHSRFLTHSESELLVRPHSCPAPSSMGGGNLRSFYELMSSTLDIPPPLHREVTPARNCLECGAWLTSANEDDVCAPCRGWSLQMHDQEAREDRAELLQELIEA